MAGLLGGFFVDGIVAMDLYCANGWPNEHMVAKGRKSRKTVAKDANPKSSIGVFLLVCGTYSTLVCSRPHLGIFELFQQYVGGFWTFLAIKLVAITSPSDNGAMNAVFPATQAPARDARPALWMLLAALSFALMAACVKFAASAFSTAELVGWRGVVSGVIMAGWARWQGIGLRTPVPGMQAWRSAVGVVSLAAWFYALSAMPLPNAMTLNYTSGLWLSAFVVVGALWARRSEAGAHRAVWREHGWLAVCVAAGFGGVLAILQPSAAVSATNASWLAGGVGALSGLTAALAYAQVQALARVREPEARTVFYFAIGCAVAGFAAAIPSGLSSLARVEAWWLLPIGALAAVGQMAMTRAFSRGATLLVVNLAYTGIVFSVLLGWLLFAERLNVLGWLGVACVIASGIAATWIRARQSAPSERRS